MGAKRKKMFDCHRLNLHSKRVKLLFWKQLPCQSTEHRYIKFETFESFSMITRTAFFHNSAKRKKRTILIKTKQNKNTCDSIQSLAVANFWRTHCIRTKHSCQSLTAFVP